LWNASILRPGAHLIHLASSRGIQIIPVPGPSSLTAAISVLDFKLEKFVLAAFYIAQHRASARAHRAKITQDARNPHGHPVIECALA
jgi:16S rRNA C1402 (ribose-2'-O) methylase RsmI